ncbi:MAG: spore cortex-lytic enzyme, partial [Acetatifactor sp.]|nr:spore cortex-lytic enzyme [Acetatifactor sp.]
YVVGSRGNVVEWWQRRCNEILAHDQDVDGLYGKNARSETIALQKRLNLTQDGVAGYNSIQAVFYN